MRQNEESETNSLAETLAAWRVDPPANPAFRTEVWQRIERAAEPEGLSFGRWLLRHGRGVAMAAAASVLVAVGAAGWAAQAQVSRERAHGVAMYLQSIDPHRQVLTEPAP